MTLTTELRNKINELRSILAERLLYSRTWQNVECDPKKTRLVITWFNSKHDDDPLGAHIFEKKVISPLNNKRLSEVIDRQKRNLDRDRRDAGK